jgi:hypothetical protein
MPAFVARKTVGEQRVCEECGAGGRRSASFKNVAALDNPIAGKTKKHPQEWYHGSPHEFEHFDDPAETSDLAYEHDDNNYGHWNVLLGNHFTSDHRVAADFAGGEHSSSANTNEGGPLSHVIHTKLHLKNPKVYASEHDMDQEVHEFEHAQGNTLHKIYPRPKDSDPSHVWDEYADDTGQAHHYSDDEKPFGRDEADPAHGYNFHPRATGWLNTHPDKYNIASRYKQRLKDQGHDGIVYGNEYEQSHHGKAATSAIAFEPHQIEITQHHYGRQGCLNEDEAKQRAVHPHQMMLPGTDDLSRKLPHERPIDTSKPWPHTWTPSFFENKKHPEQGNQAMGSRRSQGEDTGRLRAPLPQECWDRYYGRHTGSQSRTAKSWTMKYTTYAPEGGYVDKEREVHAPLYHGSRSKRLGEDGLIVPGRKSNSWGDEGPKSKHVFFTENLSTAQSYADQAGGHVYEVEPTGEFHTDYNGEDYKTKHPLKVVRRVTQEKTAAVGEESARNHAGQQDVYAVRSGNGMVNLCGYHADTHVGNSAAADALADQTGIGGRERSAEKLGEARKGSCAACNRDTGYQLKLLTPRWMSNARSDRQRRNPDKPLNTRPLPTLKQSENAKDGHYCKVCKDHHEYGFQAEEHESSQTDWDRHYPDVGEIHRGVAVRLPQDLHDRLHAEDDDLEENDDSRGFVMHDLVQHLNTKPGGWHWTTDHRKAAEFAANYAGHAHEDHDTPLTHLVLTGHRPDRQDIETDPHKLDSDEHEGVSSYDENSGEKEVPLKRGTKVHIKSIDWRPHAGTTSWGGGGMRGYSLQDDDEVVGPRHVTAGVARLRILAEWYDDDDDDDDDEDDEPDECEHCGADKNDSESHAETHHDWIREQKWHTDWDEDREVGAHNNGEVQRGMAISLPQHVHDVVHDEDRPLHERGKALADHVIKSANDRGHIGRFWTDEDEVAQRYAAGSRISAGSKDDNKTPATPVTLHVKFPGYHHVETDPDELEHHGVYSYHIENNREVPLQHGTPLEVSGVSWSHHKYGDDGPRHWDSKNADWKRHTFKEPIKAMSSKQRLPSLRTLAHDATENQAIRHCPFCGGGKIIGRADGSVECEFCHNFFTVQIQPQYPNFPQTIDGMPQQIPGMPGQVETPGGAPGMDAGGLPPGAEGEESGDAPPWAQEESEGAQEDPAEGEEPEEDQEPPPFAKKSLRTSTGALLSEDDYARHLAIRLAPDRGAMIARIREERGAQ